VLYKVGFEIMEVYILYLVTFITFIGLAVGYWKFKRFFESLLIDKRVLALLILGGLTTSIINVPIFLSIDRMYAINIGGVIIPLIVSGFFIYKLRKFSGALVLMVGAITLVTYILSSIEQNVGVVITYPGYVLLGADIIFLMSTLPSSWKIGYIGGGGIFDLVFLSGLFAMASSLILVGMINKYKTIHSVQQKRSSGHPGINIDDHQESIRFSTLKKRFLAFIIDCTLQGVIFGGIILSGIFLLNLNPVGLMSGMVGYTIFWWLIVFHILYFVIFEYILGQTPGKKFINIRVISLSLVGTRAKLLTMDQDLLSIFTRNFLRIFDLFLVIFNIFWISQLPKRQRFGDIFANTGVISS
jgi:uncharacterized RDD family membrane protein YckC